MQLGKTINTCELFNLR
jgi:hypothetical protein